MHFFKVVTYEVFDADRVQVGGVSCVLQVGQSGAEFIVNTLPAVIVPLQVQQVSDGVNGCQNTQRRPSQDVILDQNSLKVILMFL